MDGGYVTADYKLNELEVMYNIGVGSLEYMSFEVDLLSRFPNIKAIRSFDPTVDEFQVPKVAKLDFRPWGLAGSDNHPYYTLETLI
jgi:hypothetical protein